jgi:hypothetical protein
VHRDVRFVPEAEYSITLSARERTVDGTVRRRMSALPSFRLITFMDSPLASSTPYP